MNTRRTITNWGQSISKYMMSGPLSLVDGFLTAISEVMQFGTSASMTPPFEARTRRPHTPATLFLMNLIPKLDNFSPSELHVRLEAKITAQLVGELSKIFTEQAIFVVTPHRVQRTLVTIELASLGISVRTNDTIKLKVSSRIWVDTTERMQGTYIANCVVILGSEADIVVCLFSHTHMPSLRRDLDFLYNRPRLNVAISRAKAMSIIISSEGVLNPPIEAIVNKENLDGFTYLKAYEDRAWCYTQTMHPTIYESSPMYFPQRPH